MPIHDKKPENVYEQLCEALKDAAAVIKINPEVNHVFGLMDQQWNSPYDSPQFLENNVIDKAFDQKCSKKITSIALYIAQILSELNPLFEKKDLALKNAQHILDLTCQSKDFMVRHYHLFHSVENNLNNITKLKNRIISQEEETQSFENRKNNFYSVK